MNGTIVLPADTGYGRELVNYVRGTWWNKEGARFTRTVALLLRQVCDSFRLDPESLADSTATNFDHLASSNGGLQVAFVAYDCPRDMKHDSRHRGEKCVGFVHTHWMPGDNIYHYRALSFNGSAIEVAKKLRSYFKPISTGPSATAGGIDLPDLGGLEDRIGLTDFKRGL